MYDKTQTEKLKKLISSLHSANAAVQLVREGADPNTKSDKGDSLLHILSERNSPFFQEYIIELVDKLKAKVDIEDAKGFTPLQRLISCDNFDPDHAMVLVRLGANPNMKSEKGDSLLHILSKCDTNYLQKYIIEYIIELVRVFKAKIDIEDAQGFTPLQRLIKWGFSFHRSTAMALVRLGANPNTKSENGDSLLHLLSRDYLTTPHHYIGELIKDFKAEIDIKDAKGFTPLQRLIEWGISYILDNAMALVRHGADPNTKSDKGDSLLHILSKHHKDCPQEYIVELVDKLGAKVDIKDSAGFTPLQRLISRDHFDPSHAMALVRLGADPNRKSDKGGSLLHILSKHDKDCPQEYIVELVDKLGAKIDIEDEEGFTPLHRLIDGAFFTTGKALVLMKLGADFNRKVKHGISCLDYLLESTEDIAKLKLFKDLFFIVLTANSTQQKLISSKINEFAQKEIVLHRKTNLYCKTPKVAESEYFKPKFDRDISLMYFMASLSKDAEKLKELAFWENPAQFADLLKEEIIQTSKASGNHQTERIEFLEKLFNEIQEFDYFDTCLKEFEIHFDKIKIPSKTNSTADPNFAKAKQEASQELEEQFSFIKKPSVSFWGEVTNLITDDQVPVVATDSQPRKSTMGTFFTNLTTGFSKSAELQSQKRVQAITKGNSQ